MCKHYHIPYYTYGNRLRYGWTLEEVLTGRKKKNR